MLSNKYPVEFEKAMTTSTDCNNTKDLGEEVENEEKIEETIAQKVLENIQISLMRPQEI